MLRTSVFNREIVTHGRGVVAGYVIYSLDGDKFRQFVEDPTEAQLVALADLVSQEVDGHYNALTEEDPIRDWPAEPDELAPIVRTRLASPDWYGDLSDTGKSLWESALQTYCTSDEDPLGFAVDSDGVYWDVIDVIRDFHRIERNAVTAFEISHFGTRPFRYTADNSQKDDFYAWHPNHSMHTPEETQKILKQVTSAGAAVRDSGLESAISDYEDELVPALERIVQEKRVLFIAVDT